MARTAARMNEVRKGQATCARKGKSAASTTARKIRGPRCGIGGGHPSLQLSSPVVYARSTRYGLQGLVLFKVRLDQPEPLKCKLAKVLRECGQLGNRRT